MPLTTEERQALVEYRLEKSQMTLVEAKDCAKLGHWTLAANRLYYAMFYAASALLLNKGLNAKTHNGMISLLSQKFVKESLLTKEDGMFISRLQMMRHTGDYDDFSEWTEEDVASKIPRTEQLLARFRELISKS